MEKFTKVKLTHYPPVSQPEKEAATLMRNVLVIVTAIALLGTACSDNGDPVVSTATPSSGSATSAPASASAAATTPPTRAATTAPTATPAPKVARIGDTTEIGGSKYTVNAVQDPSPAGLFKPKAGMRFVSIDVTQVATKEGDNFNTFYFALQAADAFVYGPTITNAEPRLSSGTLTLGQATRGWVGFEVPEAAVIVSVLTQPEPIGGRVVIADLR